MEPPFKLAPHTLQIAGPSPRLNRLTKIEPSKHKSQSPLFACTVDHISCIHIYTYVDIII